MLLECQLPAAQDCEVDVDRASFAGTRGRTLSLKRELNRLGGSVDWVKDLKCTR